VRTRLAAALLAALALLCGTAVGCVALATRQASWHQIETAGGSLVGAVLLFYLGVVFFTG
jgi:hypothetical protein